MWSKPPLPYTPLNTGEQGQYTWRLVGSKLDIPWKNVRKPFTTCKRMRHINWNVLQCLENVLSYSDESFEKVELF